MSKLTMNVVVTISGVIEMEFNEQGVHMKATPPILNASHTAVMGHDSADEMPELQTQEQRTRLIWMGVSSVLDDASKHVHGELKKAGAEKQVDMPLVQRAPEEVQ